MNLYSRRTLGASLALVLAGILGFTAANAQRRKPHKLRATALVVLTTSRSGTTTARLIPITILDDGSFHDASIYKSTPQPMALDGGVVYEAQKTGQPVGYVTVDGATKDRNGNWSATGKWRVAGPAPKASPTVSVPTGSPDERPILHREGTPSPNAGGSAAPPAPSPAPSESPSSDRPVLHRTPSENPPQNTPGPAPAQGAPTPAATPTPAASPEAAEAPEDPNRPTLRHRTPGSAKEETDAKAAATPTPAAGQTAAAPATTPKTTPSTGIPAGGQILVAVSDAQTSESRSYEFLWKAGEKEAIESKMRRLALAQLFPDKAGSLSNDGALAALKNIVIRGFDLDLSNDAVMVLTAELPADAVTASEPPAGSKPAGRKLSSPGAAANPPPASHARRYVTVIARVDFEGNPQKLAASVTDSSRLDVAPRLELIDAVDVDGDGLGELLFREYSFDDQSYVIYSIGRSTVTKLFEGASQPLK